MLQLWWRFHCMSELWWRFHCMLQLWWRFHCLSVIMASLVSLCVSPQGNGASWLWPVWDSEQGDMAVSSWCCGSGCEDTAV